MCISTFSVASTVQFYCCLCALNTCDDQVYPPYQFSDNHPTATGSQLEFTRLSTPTVKLPALITTLRPMCSINFMIRLMQCDQVIFIPLYTEPKTKKLQNRSEVLIAPWALISSSILLYSSICCLVTPQQMQNNNRQQSRVFSVIVLNLSTVYSCHM